VRFIASLFVFVGIKLTDWTKLGLRLLYGKIFFLAIIIIQDSGLGRKVEK
jgi:hypothetical protein